MDTEEEKRVSQPSTVVTVDSIEHGQAQAEDQLNKSIPTWKFILMTLGGSIGAGLLVSTHKALEYAGAGSVTVAFTIVGASVMATMGALGELTATYPTQGSFYEYSVRFISPAWGFSMGWNYCINFLLIVPFEITVMCLLVKFWSSQAAQYLVPAFLVPLFILAYLGADIFANAENIFGALKVSILQVFTLTAIVMATGGTPNDVSANSAINWGNFAFVNGYQGFLYVFVAAALSYGGTEMIGLTIGESKEPRKAMPLATKVIGLRIVFCYLIPLAMVGTVAPRHAGYSEGHSSPFVLAVRDAGIPYLPDIINGTILVAVFSMANASVFASSRALHAICARGMGPRLLSRTTKKGLPLRALAVVAAFSLLSIVNVSPHGSQVFDWLMAVACASNNFTWASICLAHIRVRMAIARQGRSSRDVLKWRSPTGVWGSVFGFTISVLGLVAQIVSAARPPVGDDPIVLVLVRNAIGFVVVIGAWLGWLIWKDHTLFVALDDIKVDAE